MKLRPRRQLNGSGGSGSLVPHAVMNEFCPVYTRKDSLIVSLALVAYAKFNALIRVAVRHDGVSPIVH